MKTKFKKKSFGFLLAFCMVLGMTPITMFAAEGATTTVYYNFQQVTTGFNAGTPYLFTNAAVVDSDCLTSVPEGSALLTATDAENECTFYADGLSLSAYVNVTQSGTGFDSCSAGGLFSEGSLYFCEYGGATDIPGKTYSYQTAVIGADAIQAVVKPGTTIPTGETTLTQDNITMTITVDGKGYVVNDYTFSDDIVNYRGGDDSVTLTFNGVPITVKITGLSRQVWLEDNAAIIADKAITKDDLPAIIEAMAEGKNNAEVTPEDLSDLQSKLDAGEFAMTYETALCIAQPSISDYATLKAAKDAYDALADQTRAYLDASVSTPLLDNMAAVNQLIDDSASQFVKNYVSDGTGKVYTQATANNKKQILNGETDWDNLSQVEKDAVNSKLAAAGGQTYEQLLSDAKALSAKGNVTANSIPKTGDNTLVIPFVLSALLSAAYIVTMGKKRKCSDNA